MAFGLSNFEQQIRSCPIFDGRGKWESWLAGKEYRLYNVWPQGWEVSVTIRAWVTLLHSCTKSNSIVHYNRISQEGMNSPAVFQGLVNHVLKDIKDVMYGSIWMAEILALKLSSHISRKCAECSNESWMLVCGRNSAGSSLGSTLWTFWDIVSHPTIYIPLRDTLAPSRYCVSRQTSLRSWASHALWIQ